MPGQVLRNVVDAKHICRTMVIAGSLVILITGAMVIAGWLFGIDALKSILPGFATMKFNTAFCFLLTGTALFSTQFPDHFSQSVIRVHLGEGLILLVMLLSGLTLVQYSSGINFGIDNLVVYDSFTELPQWPGRMSQASALCFVMISAGLLLLNINFRSNWLISQFLALLVLVISGTALLGYVFGIVDFRSALFSTMAIHTASLFVIAAICLVAGGPAMGLKKGIISQLSGSRYGRAILPLIIFLPIFSGWIILNGVINGSYSMELGFALNSLLVIAVFGALIFLGSQKLDDAEERLIQTIEYSPIAMLMIDIDGTIVQANAQMVSLFGYSKNELHDMQVEALLPENIRAKHVSHRREFFLAPQPRAMGEGRDLLGLRKDGSEFPVEISLGPLRTAKGLFVLAQIADITWRKQAEFNLKEKSAELVRSNQDLEQFAYIASHDLQEPLRSVSGCLQILQRRYQDKFDDKADELINHAVDGSHRMQALIDGLLEYSRVGRTDGAAEDISADDALQKSMANLQTAIEEARASINSCPLPIVHIVPIHLIMIFQNLISNAIKFRKPEQSPLHITISVEQDNAFWLFSVKDNGMGFDESHAKRIFEVFQRLHPHHKYPGTGLGLALCKKIIEQAGGTIWAHSTPDSGTTIYFTLPNNNSMPDTQATGIAGD